MPFSDWKMERFASFFYSIEVFPIDRFFRSEGVDVDLSTLSYADFCNPQFL